MKSTPNDEETKVLLQDSQRIQRGTVHVNLISQIMHH